MSGKSQEALHQDKEVGNEPVSSSDINPTDDTTITPPPDGGMKAWLVASGAACIFFSALGFANSFGVFMEYYLSHQLRDQSADKVAWIGSVAVFMQFATGMVGGPLFDRYGAWVCLFIYPQYETCRIYN